MVPDLPTVWRYATGVGDKEDLEIIKKGWIREK
jgi:hypothetical protein